MIADWILKPALAVALAFVLTRFTKRAAIRHFAWVLAFAALAVLRVMPEPSAVIRVSAPVPAAVQGIIVDVRPTPTTPSTRATDFLPIIWAAGLAFVWARLAWALFRAHRITAQATGTSIRISPQIASPFTWGALRPVIVLPEESSVWTPERFRHVIAHEEAHIARADWATQIAARLLCGVYWFHPAVWWAARQMRAESERACDDAVLTGAGATPEEYAEDLLDLARSAGKPVQTAVVGIFENTSELEERIMRILANTNRKGLGRLAAVAMSVAALVTFAPMASVRILAQAAPTTVLKGVINDPSGARVPGAKVSILAVPSGEPAGAQRRVLASTTSGPDGSYSLALGDGVDRNGVVQVLVEKPGFAARIGGVKLGGGVEMIRDFGLTLGQISEGLEVAGVRPANMPAPPPGPPARIRVGGNVQAANLIRKTNPEYPKDLQDKGIQGTVELEAIVSKEGNVLSVHPRSKTVHEGLIEAAAAAVRTWQYRPTLLNGEPVEVVTTVTVRFYLK